MLFPDFSFLGEGLRTRCKSTKQMKLLVENLGFILFAVKKKLILQVINRLFMKADINVPIPVLRRMPSYLSFVKTLQKQGEKYVSSTRIAEYMEIDSTDAQQARRVLDRLVGYKLSTLLNHKIENDGGGKTLSGGRVQSVALRLIVEREREIEAFVPKEYWNISALLSDKEKKHAPFKAALEKKNGKKYKPRHTIRIKSRLWM